MSALWAIAVMREWRHPLLGQLLPLLSTPVAKPTAAGADPFDPDHTNLAAAGSLGVAGLSQLAQFLLLASAEGLLQVRQQLALRTVCELPVSMHVRSRPGMQCL